MTVASLSWLEVEPHFGISWVAAEPCFHISWIEVGAPEAAPGGPGQRGGPTPRRAPSDGLTVDQVLQHWDEIESVRAAQRAKLAEAAAKEDAALAAGATPAAAHAVAAQALAETLNQNAMAKRQADEAALLAILIQLL
jgi:hypothetical protein